MREQIDPAIANDWFAVASIAALEKGRQKKTRLMGLDLWLARDADGTLKAWLAQEPSAPVHLREHCGCLWVCLGDAPRPMFALPEFDDPGRRFIYMGAFGVHTGGLRAIENFLDMAHFPFVHPNFLGGEPNTEVLEYAVEIDAAGELWAHDCRFIQPRGTAAASGSVDAEYTYRIVNPFTAMLYKNSADHPHRRDIIFLAVQPVEEEECIGHFSIALFDDVSTDSQITNFQQTIFGQDKPLLQDHVIKKLPLDPGFEVPTRADAASVAFRRWLRDINLHYGADWRKVDNSQGRRPVRVARKWPVAQDVVAFELQSVDDSRLPVAAAGAHLDVQLPNGLVRQYSICDPAGSDKRYVIAVKREPDSRGGSLALHDSVQPGDLLRVSLPRNNFPLDDQAAHSVLLAGGIGLTPVLAMARTLARQNRSFELHVFARSSGHLPFGMALPDEFGHRLHLHLGLNAVETQQQLQRSLEAAGAESHLYGCGPAPFMQAIGSLAATLGYATAQVHFEHFKASHPVSTEGEAFSLRLARSGLSITVRSGQTVLDAVRSLGVPLESNCEQGVCGTCQCGLIAGAAEHRDSYLSEAERRSGKTFIPCVSRASGELVLDL